MARRRGRKGKGRKGSRAIPVIQTLMVGYPVVNRFASRGFSKDAVVGSVFDLTGYDATQNKFTDYMRGVKLGVGLVLVSTIGGKIANKSGANKLLKKVSGGYLKFA